MEVAILVSSFLNEIILMSTMYVHISSQFSDEYAYIKYDINSDSQFCQRPVTSVT